MEGELYNLSLALPDSLRGLESIESLIERKSHNFVDLKRNIKADIAVTNEEVFHRQLTSVKRHVSIYVGIVLEA